MQFTLDNVQIMDVTDTANNVNDAETNEMFDVVNSFVRVHNIEKYRIIVEFIIATILVIYFLFFGIDNYNLNPFKFCWN